MSNDTKSNTGQLPQVAHLKEHAATRHGGTPHVRPQISGQGDEWERRMKQLNPQWQPHRHHLAEVI
jgi:hypothetical protein